MGNFVTAYITSFVTMIALDALWLGLVAPAFYKKHIGFILAEKTNWLAAGIFYLIFIFGVTLFVVYPGWRNAESLTKIAIMGAVFGLVTYATYDLTNQATLKNWPIIVTVVDLLWGTVLIAGVSSVAVIILRNFVK